MIDQHRRPTLSHTVVQCSPQSSWDLALMGGPGYSTQPWDLLVPDASISGTSSPSLSMMHQHENSSYSPIVEVDTIMNMYKPPLGDPPNHHPKLFPSGETFVPTAHQRPLAPLYSLPDIFPEPQTRVKAPGDQFEVQGDYMVSRAPKILYAQVNTHTPQPQDQTNESQAITIVVAKSSASDRERAMAEDVHTPMISCDGIPLSHDCSCSPTCSTSGDKVLNAIPQEANKSSQRHSQGEPLVDLDLVLSSTISLSQLFTTQDRSTGLEEMAEKPYQCRFCRVSFAQRQGLTRHSKDMHSPKNRCDFCVKFTWPQGRRYVYRKHLQEEHPGFVSPSVGANPIRRRRGVKSKGQHFCENSFARRTS